MSELNNLRFPSRKNPRLQGYDYSTDNCYFITICTYQKQCIFGLPGSLNEFGTIAERHFIDIEKHFPRVRIHKFVVMPNHIHGILELADCDVTLPAIIGQYKASVTRSIRRHAPLKKVWQTSFHDHIIRNESGYKQIWGYIDNNPAQWEQDCFYSSLSL